MYGMEKPMLLGRNTQMQILEEMYSGKKSTLTLLYGRTGIGKTELIKRFCKGKKCILYSANQASTKEQFSFMRLQIEGQVRKLGEGTVNMTEDYAALFSLIPSGCVFVVEEFQNIVRVDKSFMAAITSLVHGELGPQNVMVICSSSSISWIENSLVSSIGANVYTVTTFLKLKELSFVDTVRMFPGFSVSDCVYLYAITGGVPKYLRLFSDKQSLKDNICRLFLMPQSVLKDEGSDYVKEELRETALYNTILYCIASGETKLNELHLHTGFGRDKISVYLKNLMEREIVEKIFSFDTKGNEHTKKGLYGIKASMVAFWFNFIFAHQTELMYMQPAEFYDEFIANGLDDFAAETFIKVGTEYIELMDSVKKLPITIERRGRWWGKDGNIDLIACDNDGKYIVCKCNWETEEFTFDMFEKLRANTNLAKIGSDYVYLFSRGTFDEKLTLYAKENGNIFLVGIDDL